MSNSPETMSDRSDQSDRVDILELFRSDSTGRTSDQSDHVFGSGPTGPTRLDQCRTNKIQLNQSGPTGPTGPTQENEIGEDAAAPDADGVARSPEAIEAVWSEATRRAVEIRKTMKPPTCARCGKSEWTVSVTEPTGRKLHVQCWKAEAREAERQRNEETETKRAQGNYQ